MRVLRFGQHLVQITKFPSVFPISAYVVVEDDGLTLIDTGLGGSGREYQAHAAALGRPLRRIVLTHAHGDHVGSLDELAAALPDAEIIASARDARFLAGERSLDPGEPQTPLRGSITTVKTQPTRTVNAGDRIGSLEVVATPGHTPGHIALLDTRDGAVIAGDAFVTLGGMAVSGTFTWGFPIGPLVTWHRPSAVESARRLLALKPTRLAVGHGPVLEGAAALAPAMADAIRKAEQSLVGGRHG